MSRTTLPEGLRKKLIKLYGQKKGTRVGDPKNIAKMLASGTKISTFMKKGGHVRKKTKKKK